MSLRTSNIPFKDLIERQVHDEVMQKAVANAQETIGKNRQKMVDELGHWEDWRDRAAQIRDHVLANLDGYLYQLSEKIEQHGGHVFFAKTKDEATQYILDVAKEKKSKKNSKSQVDGDRRNRHE